MVLRRIYGLSSMCLRPTTITSHNQVHFTYVRLSQLKRERESPVQGAVRLGSCHQNKKSKVQTQGMIISCDDGPPVDI